MSTLLKQSTNRNVMVLMIDATDDETGLAGLTLTITASKDGGSFASITPTVTDRGDGNYALALSTVHTDTLGDLVLHVEAVGANDYDEKFQVVADLPGATVSTVGTVTGNVNGSTASVTGAVGSVAGNISGSVVGNVNGTVVLHADSLAAIHNWAAGAETYAADGAVPTPFQLLLQIWGSIGNVSRNSTTGVITVYKLDGVTPAMTFVPDVAPPLTPNAYTRAT